jgi:hypothetical protein
MRARAGRVAATLLLLSRAGAQIASPTSTSSPGLNASAPGAWWINRDADISGADLGNTPGFASADLCRAACVAYGPTCGGCVWDVSTALCWLKNAAGGWVYSPPGSPRPGLVSSLLLPRLTAAVIATIPSPTVAPTVSATQGFSLTATASPAASAVAASLVWQLAVDERTGLGAFSSTAGNWPSNGPVFVNDRNGCPGGALSLLNGAYATATGVVGLPPGQNDANAVSDA